MAGHILNLLPCVRDLLSRTQPTVLPLGNCITRSVVEFGRQVGLCPVQGVVLGWSGVNIRYIETVNIRSPENFPRLAFLSVPLVCVGL